MAAITPTKVTLTEFSGKRKVLVLTAVPGSASDTVTLTQATHGISTIESVTATLTGGQDVALTGVQATFSGLVITLATFEQDWTAATDWTGAEVTLLIVGY